MGVDFHRVCFCGSNHSDYILSTGIRRCRECNTVLSINNVFQEGSPCYSLTEEQMWEYFKTDVHPNEELFNKAKEKPRPPSWSDTMHKKMIQRGFTPKSLIYVYTSNPSIQCYPYSSDDLFYFTHGSGTEFITTSKKYKDVLNDDLFEKALQTIIEYIKDRP